MNQGPLSFLEELRRRNVVRVGVVYLVTAWLLAQVADLLLENFLAPDWVIQAILVVLIIGFPIALIFAWAFELTPEGLKREHEVDRSQSITPQTGRKLDFMIIGILAVALAYFIWESRFEKGSEPFSGSEVASPNASPGVDPNKSEKVPEKGSDPFSRSIAVLPFVNMSSDPEQEYFSDGISEELLNSLAKVKELKVAGRTSSFAFKGENQDLRKVGEALGVANILEGSVRKSGNKVRITAQLIQVNDGFHLWSESYDRELTDVFAIQDEIATAILNELKLALLDEQPKVVESARADTQAYELYLLAKQRMYERTGPTIKSAVDLLDRAIAIDPAYAPAYAQRGIAELLLSEGTGSYGDIPLAQALSNGKRYLDKALELDPELAEGWAGIGLYFNNKPVITDEGIEPLRKALAINPNLIDASNWLAVSLLDLGRPSEARDVMLALVERDPLYRPGVRNMVNSFMWFGEYEKAEAFIASVEPLIPNDATLLSSRAAISVQSGHPAQALQLVEQAIALQPSNSVARMTRGFALLNTQQLERVAVEGSEWQPILALAFLDRVEEARQLAYKRAEELADAGTLLNILNITDQPAEAVRYIEERWPDLDSLERNFPPYGGLGHLMMLDVALAYSRTGNSERFNDAQQRTARVHADLARQGVDNPIFFLSEASYYAMAGDPDTSLEFLDRAVSRGFITSTPRIVREYPYLATLEGDPRFEAIQAKMLEHLNAERAELGLEPVSI
jgi:TolB-like protein/Tfp pilus assembly protein PilF